MATPFQNIKIIEVEKRLTHKVNEATHQIYLSLSATPSDEWIKYFDEAWSASKGHLWRSAGIEGNYIVITCSLNELANEHKDPLTQAVDIANRSYTAYLQRQVASKLADQARKKADDDEIDDFNNKVKF